MRRAGELRLRLLLPLALAPLGCNGSAVPLDLTSSDPTVDQIKIAGHHDQEAAFFRSKAEEYRQRVLVYQDLFGTDSDWVRGAYLLARFYEAPAEEQERLAEDHHHMAERDARRRPNGIHSR